MTLSANLEYLALLHSGLAKEIGNADALPTRHADYPLDYDAKKAAVVLCVGWSPWVTEAMARLGDKGVVIVWEPDTGAIRADLERADRRSTLRALNLRWCRTADDIRPALKGLETIVAQGVRVLWHPDDANRLHAPGLAFLEAFTTTLAAMRTNIVTTGVLMERITRNLVDNLEAFVTRSVGISQFKGIAKGKPALVVAAGPSLGKNEHLIEYALADFLVIAVQTVLKRLIALQAPPHLVCAIDHHDLSGRFYEGLTASDVNGIGLVCSPNASPVVARSWPGKLCMMGDGFYDAFLDEPTTQTHGNLFPGSTVAHTAYYLARYMGADPVVMIGQDLGFTDGNYYGPGAAIHQVWSGELSEFNTLEMMEHQRVVRGREGNIRKADQDGRPIYTDVQMSTYLDVFNSVWKRDQAAGLTTIDATEGGMPKEGCVKMPLWDAIRTYGPLRARYGPYAKPSKPRRRVAV